MKRLAGERLSISSSAVVPQMLSCGCGRAFPFAVHTNVAVSASVERLKAGERLGQYTKNMM